MGAIKHSGKPACPACGSEDVARIVYGLPSPEAREQAARGEFVLGGCCVSNDDPKWCCRDCAHRWGGAPPHPGRPTG